MTLPRLLVLDVKKDIPSIEARAGDRLFVRPGHREAPFVLMRDLPDNLALSVMSDQESVAVAYDAPPVHVVAPRARRGLRLMRP